MKNFIGKIILTTIVGTSHLEAAPTQTQSLNELMEDTKAYKTTNTGFHAGNLYEHCVWVAMTIQKWFNEKNNWTRGLTARDQIIAHIAGLLHDIGKGGDLIYLFHTKPTHPERGQNYILGYEQYTLTNGKIFNFKALLQTMGFSAEEQQIISILVGAHHCFGDLMKSLNHLDLRTNKKAVHASFKNYVENLSSCALRAHYKKPLTTRIIRLALLVAIADVKGAGPCDCHHSLMCEDFKVLTSPSRVHGAPDKFVELDYECRGKQIHEALLTYLKGQEKKL